MEGGSSTFTPSAFASALSENAAVMWTHYQTVQTYEPHLRIGQQSIVEQIPNCKHSTMAESHEINRAVVALESNRGVGGIPVIETCEGEVGNDGEEAKGTDGSLQPAALVPLPSSPSPITNSPPSSPSSSCFVTPTSTPSRSPTPSRHQLSRHQSPPMVHDTLKQLSQTAGYSDDGSQGGSQERRQQMDDFFDSPITQLRTMFDIETQTLPITVVDSYTQTDLVIALDKTTNTENEETPVLIDTESQTTEGEGGGLKGESCDVGCNTELQISPELEERAQLSQQIARLQSEMTAGVLERNEAKSQQMVAEELARIVQSELVELRQRTVAETTARVRLENYLGELKVELSSARKELKEKDERINELEETLKGTSLLVRKLKEQNAVSLMNRGGIDYMLQAKLADARAQEAEQKLEVAQTELLQRQGEVKRLLDRVGEATRDRSEMVSSKVHNQLLQIADERAHTAEQKALQLERELLSLRDKFGESGISETGSHLSSSSRSSSTYPSALGGYTTLSSTLLPPSYVSSPYSLSTSTLPSSSSVSLEPFKLSFSLPSSNVSSLAGPRGAVNDSERAPSSSSLSSSSSLLATGTDQHTGLLKPSSVLAKGSRSGRHVMWERKSDQALSESTTMSPTQPTLPSVIVPTSQFSLPSPPITDTSETSRDQESSSEWSSSSEEEDGESEDDEGGASLRPSTHSALQAQWEWRAMEGSLSDRSLMATGHTPKKNPPPPVAPKPRSSWTASASTSTIPDSTPYQLLEDPSSFSMPARSSELTSLTSSFARPRGPQGRRLPSRFS